MLVRVDEARGHFLEGSQIINGLFISQIFVSLWSRGAGTDPPQPSPPTSTSQNKTDQSKDGAASSSSPMMMMSVEKLAVARASLQLNLVHNTQIVQVGGEYYGTQDQIHELQLLYYSGNRIKNSRI